MVFDISIVMTWLLFLALFPMAFFWLRRARKIFIKKDYSEVALKRGASPPNPEKWATLTGLTNLVAGGIAVVTIASVTLPILAAVLSIPLDISPPGYKTWSATAGMTLWGKIFADLIISRQAHPFTLGKKKKQPKKS